MVFRISQLAFIALMTAASLDSAEARTHFSFSFNHFIPAPVVVPGPCVYAQPVYGAPIYAEPVYPPPVAVVQPAPVVVAPTPVVVGSPYYTVPVMRQRYTYAPTVVRKTRTIKRRNMDRYKKTVKRSYYR